MEHRNWNKNNIRTSLLGYGCMRFPTKADGTIDEERAEALLNTAKAAGVNYFDTAYPYHNGQSEPFVGRVIAKWDRSSFYLATKMPLWSCKSLDDAKRIFEEQLQRLGVDVGLQEIAVCLSNKFCEVFDARFATEPREGRHGEE